ncbi:MAG: threonine--tRNA ligase [Spirochaetia bacterium]
MSNIDLSTLRHSCAHVMASAIQHLYGKDVQFAIGPSIEEGFYYDLECTHTFTVEDFEAIEKEMAKIILEKHDFVRQEITRAQGQEIFKDQKYKLEIITDLPTDAALSTYQVGDFLDLCKGPHVENTRQIASEGFKLLSVAGAYWRGDEKRPMLQRIYATAFASKKELKEFLAYKEEMEKRDHRRLGKELDLFSFHEEAGPGLAFWQPYGGRIRVAVEDFWRAQHVENGYEFVFSPHIGKRGLWETSGHLSFYQESMYSPMQIDEDQYFVKPMNCPFHVLIYKNGQHSYRDLPCRWAELGTVYRYERAGALHGLPRVRGFTQDDAHIMCTPDQLMDEIQEVIRFSLFMLRSFGFKDINAYLSTQPKESVGEKERWDDAQEALRKAMDIAQLPYQVDEGGGAFYGPKIDIKVKDSMNREWQLSTIQVDFNLPERFDMVFIDKDGQEKRPYMVHRALFGSIERFFGVLIEHFGGAFPLWMAPRQVYVVPVAPAFYDYAKQVSDACKKAGLRSEADLSDNRMNAKIRYATSQKIPYILVVGGRDVEANTASIRLRGHQDQRADIPLQKIIDEIQNKNMMRVLEN